MKPFISRIHHRLGDIDAAAWNALLARQPAATPFMRHEYLDALEACACAEPATGWHTCFLTLHEGNALVAACPLYLKDHSYGEYVFDWAWADAYERHGVPYYPKLVCAVPFTPVPGARLLAHDGEARMALLRALREIAAQSAASSAHLLYLDAEDRQAAEAAGWLMRSNVQFHWHNDPALPHRDFAAFLSCLQREKRKKIQQERRRVADAGVHFSVAEGTEIDEASWDYFYRCYTKTYRAHHSTPYLTREFFRRMARTMPENWLLFTAWRGEDRIAASLIAIDPLRRVAFGRYWGATQPLPCLHFEACYYQPLAWCIANAYLRFEGGAQGEHKMARGLLPVQTWSAHWLAHPQFAAAVGEFLAREGAGISEYMDQLDSRAPYKPALAPTGSGESPGPGSINS